MPGRVPGADRSPEDPDPEDRETVVTRSLREIDAGRCELLLDQGDFAAERRRDLHEEGWSQSLGKLVELPASRRD
ncbi:hypothetical protein [Streptomyces sp. NPDC007984]|uniref:hypothetical protein n=1 Tax=Streptomyces sp. NPDC007984 TaxID=3364801 RepID=UPI0036EB961E